MHIGNFKSRNGQLLGSIATATIDLSRLGLRPVESDNDKAPVYDIMLLNVAKRWISIGALWKATSNTTGETFFQGRLDDPSLSEPLSIMLFDDRDEKNPGLNVVWTRPTPQRRSMDGSRQPRSRQRDDAFGEGNATDDGRLAEELKDEVPAFA